MIVLYHDVGGAHSSAVAANIHINRLPVDRIPDGKELLSLPTFDKIVKSDLGHLIYIGVDELGSKVYTIGCRYQSKLIIPAVRDMFNILQDQSSEQLLLVDTSPSVNLLMKIGGFTSRKLKFVALGRPIVTYGTQKAYFDIVNIVTKAKEQLKK